MPHSILDPRRLATPKPALLAAFVLTLGSLNSGCASQDKSVYTSTIHLPTTVAVKDTVTDELIWKLDVPVEHELVLDYNRANEAELLQVRAELPADRMAWKVRKRDKRTTVASGDYKLPYPHTVMTVVSYRPGPELPGESPGAIEPETFESEPERASRESPAGGAAVPLAEELETDAAPAADAEAAEAGRADEGGGSDDRPTQAQSGGSTKDQPGEDAAAGTVEAESGPTDESAMPEDAMQESMKEGESVEAEVEAVEVEVESEGNTAGPNSAQTDGSADQGGGADSGEVADEDPLDVILDP